MNASEKVSKQWSSDHRIAVEEMRVVSDETFDSRKSLLTRATSSLLIYTLSSGWNNPSRSPIA